MKTTCCCCERQAKYTVNCHQNVCGRHLTYVVDMDCDMPPNEAWVVKIKEEAGPPAYLKRINYEKNVTQNFICQKSC